MSHDDRTESLHGPWPSAAEELHGRFGAQWSIWRELRTDGTHGQWVAERLDGPLTQAQQTRGLVDRVTATSIGELRTLLESQSELATRRAER